jgi:hypothetical protein
VVEDPLWRMRHALAGLGLALLLSVFVAGLLGSMLGDALVALTSDPGAAPPADGGYAVRATFYGVLLLHVVVGAVVLFVRVAQHETRPLTAGRVVLWLASLWCWPLLFLRARQRTPESGDGT